MLLSRDLYGATISLVRKIFGLIGPGAGFFGRIPSGGRIRAVTPPGCWGPMITPHFKGGHEVTQPVYVEGARPGDAVAITIERLRVVSHAAATGTMTLNPKAFGDDPFVDKRCPNCGAPWPESRPEGTGEEAVRCARCGAEASAFHFEEGYTVTYDDEYRVALAVDEANARRIAERAREEASLPEGSEQHPILLYAPHTLSGMVARVIPNVGNIGTTPSVDMPDSHNAGDFGASLVGAHHPYALTQEQLDAHRTDAHLDCRDVREGAVLLCPVKVEGAGVYMGDAHSVMGRGELALHSIDVTADVTVRVDVLPGLELEGPILLPRPEDLPPIARPFAAEEVTAARALGERIGVAPELDVAPLQFIGTGVDLNRATENAIRRAARFLGVSEAEVRNRATVTGGVEVSRLPGAVQLTLLLPFRMLEKKGLLDLVRSQYGL
ncbi:MAG: acetamidase/formamidase family protein [Bacillota bacterium]|nr:acetamidase/formamidase family protein [Bacillota bacterium]